MKFATNLANIEVYTDIISLIFTCTSSSFIILQFHLKL